MTLFTSNCLSKNQDSKNLSLPHLLNLDSFLGVTTEEAISIKLVINLTSILELSSLSRVVKTIKNESCINVSCIIITQKPVIKAKQQIRQTDSYSIWSNVLQNFSHKFTTKNYICLIFSETCSIFRAWFYNNNSSV